MPYTLWSRGRLLGSSDLDFAFREQGHRCGWFHPAEGAEPLIEIATGFTPLIMAPDRDLNDPTVRADLAAASDRCDALDLELHGPDGAAIPCDMIGLQDCHVLIALSEPLDDEYDAWYESLDDDARAELDASIEHDLAVLEEMDAERPDTPWEPETETEFPRYQLLVQLADHRDGSIDDG